MATKIAAEHVRLKRAYDAPSGSDGTRILVDRLWPRGVRKADAAIDQWAKDIAPAPSCGNGLATIPPAGSNSAIVMLRKSWRILNSSTS